MAAKKPGNRAKLRYVKKATRPHFIPYESVPYEFEPFSKEELRGIKNGGTGIILSKPKAAAGHAKAHVIALRYAGGKRTNYISIHKGNPVTVKSVVRFILKANIYFSHTMSIRNGAPTSKAVLIARMAPEKIEYLLAMLAAQNKY
ncbi:MAG: hypothetical protein FWE91_00160 [Defluviitaleaceae bacterium]|nr:hypothetical protein [Defluviitaleaceae bacterium]MCL2836499.1 hypothetical protein [Defluviitaleaceae bacterium]